MLGEYTEKMHTCWRDGCSPLAMWFWGWNNRAPLLPLRHRESRWLASRLDISRTQMRTSWSVSSGGRPDAEVSNQLAMVAVSINEDWVFAAIAVVSACSLRLNYTAQKYNPSLPLARHGHTAPRTPGMWESSLVFLEHHQKCPQMLALLGWVYWVSRKGHLWRPRWLSGKEPTCNAGDTGDGSSILEVGNIPWKRKWPPHSSIFAWEIPWTGEPGGHGVSKSRTST